MSGQPKAQREPVAVAVGLMLRQDGAFLMASRPQGKPYAGYWEFPGGKLEAGESLQHALAREFEEELGVRVREAQFWKSLRVDYPHALVDLQFCRITAWDGEPLGLEGQQLSWQSLPVTVGPVLPGALPVLEWLAEERLKRSEPDQ
ncbi:NUDIX domain-containing protein [Thiomonas bhubaneswarensis]|uniref:8-oxo-dGTP diphosphatase n=1 Tax=Thiomonas bhubaneswarensis TaxID=339866 RepID=A0A0K6HXM4_9BURK|nr:NUDIX domain-containing protein [Thiomonas bhubaneswarensis]CUA95797.1 8-oxo-dGTPase [Thiomonas bhubaneswarensis]